MEAPSLRLLRWKNRTLQVILKNLWLFILFSVLYLAQELLKDRFVRIANHFLDAHASALLATTKPTAIYLLGHPITSMVILSMLTLLGLTLYAYFDSREAPVTESLAPGSKSGDAMNLPASHRSEGNPSSLENLGLEKVRPEVGKTEERICVPNEVTPHYIRDIYGRCTSEQASKIMAAYLGQWMRLSGEVTDVQKHRFGIRNEDERAMVHLSVADSAKKKSRPAMAVLVFQGRWLERALLLPRGAKIKVLGRIKSTSRLYTDLDECELE
ncbi:MAG TPA: hypothetical protein VJN93_04780 [Candidatus Acidoferrum sp.]|nr:hypothetical protein [Candidatus Acidoferrum sp.]